MATSTTWDCSCGQRGNVSPACRNCSSLHPELAATAGQPRPIDWKARAEVAEARVAELEASELEAQELLKKAYDERSEPYTALAEARLRELELREAAARIAKGALAQKEGEDADSRIGVCTDPDHAWWFPIGEGFQSICPEPGCHAEILLYDYAGSAQPEDPDEEDETKEKNLP